MEGPFGVSMFVTQIFERLEPRDAVQFLTTGRQAKRMSQPFATALAFALTRPQLQLSGPPLSLRTWQHLWKACAQSVAAHGLDPSVLAYADLVTKLARIDEVTICERCVLSKEETFFRSFMMKYKGGLQISAVLMLHGFLVQQEKANICALVVLADGRFAFIDAVSGMWAMQTYPSVMLFNDAADSCGWYGGGWYGEVDVESNMSALFKSVRKRVGRCHWALRKGAHLAPGYSEEFLWVLGLCYKPGTKEAGNCGNVRVAGVGRIDPALNVQTLSTKEHTSMISRAKRLAAILRQCSDQYPATAAQEPQIVQAMEPVIQDIEHIDPPARRDEKLSAVHADHEWADYIQQTAAGSIYSNASDASDNNVSNEDVYVLRFGSPAGGDTHLQHFRGTLLYGPAMQACREEMRNFGHTCELPSGALMFVKPGQVCDVLKSVANLELHHFHIVVAESFEHLVNEVITNIPFKRRPKRKSGTRGRKKLNIHSPGLPQQEVWILIEERTFLSWKPQLRDACTVAQSTTEAFSRNGANPRRFI